jgi:hypothetical protein
VSGATVDITTSAFTATGTIVGFGANTTQSIDLADFNVTGAHAISFSLGVLTLKNTAGQVVHLHFSGAHTLASFHLSNDGNFNGTDDGTKIVDPPAQTKPQTRLTISPACSVNSWRLGRTQSPH